LAVAQDVAPYPIIGQDWLAAPDIAAERWEPPFIIAALERRLVNGAADAAVAATGAEHPMG